MKDSRPNDLRVCLGWHLGKPKRREMPSNRRFTRFFLYLLATICIIMLLIGVLQEFL